VKAAGRFTDRTDLQYHPAKAPCRETGGAFLRYEMGVMKNISKILHK
jgi:hypothetical protein